jgi:hypothetical protein
MFNNFYKLYIYNERYLIVTLGFKWFKWLKNYFYSQKNDTHVIYIFHDLNNIVYSNLLILFDIIQLLVFLF